MNIKAQSIPSVLNKGYALGRPSTITEKSNLTVEDMENDGWIGVYDPQQVEVQPMTVNGSVTVSINGNAIKSIREQLLNGIKQPTSDIDARIKEVQKAKPSKYRARWTGTKYIYEPLDNGS
jgi:hypothetical protein